MSTTQDQVVMSREEFDLLKKRIEELESKVGKDDDDKSNWKQMFGEADKVMRGMMEAGMEAVNETAEAITSTTKKADKDDVGDMPAMFINTMSKMIDIQKAVLNRFQESVEKKDS